MIAMIAAVHYKLIMAQLLIRNLDDAVVSALRKRAAARGASLEEEARQALAVSVGLSRPALMARLEALRARIGAQPGPTTLDDLRADRARDE
jgi:antitoxin FitA